MVSLDALKEDLIALGQCFSFFTFVESNQKILVADIQGWHLEQNGVNILLLTDPAIHGKARRGCYGGTDLGLEGIREFLKSYDFENNK